MIASFRHKGLRRSFEDDERRLVRPDLVGRIRDLPSAIDAAQTIEDLALPTFRLHQLKGDLKGMWSVAVRANWRIVFEFDQGRASDLDLVDYH